MIFFWISNISLQCTFSFPFSFSDSYTNILIRLFFYLMNTIDYLPGPNKHGKMKQLRSYTQIHILIQIIPLAIYNSQFAYIYLCVALFLYKFCILCDFTQMMARKVLMPKFNHNDTVTLTDLFDAAIVENPVTRI